MSHADNNNELARLKVSPPLAWPTIAILIVSLISIALSWVLVMNDIWPLWLGMVINSIAGFITTGSQAAPCVMRIAPRYIAPRLTGVTSGAGTTVVQVEVNY